MFYDITGSASEPRFKILRYSTLFVTVVLFLEVFEKVFINNKDYLNREITIDEDMCLCNDDRC